MSSVVAFGKSIVEHLVGASPGALKGMRIDASGIFSPVHEISEGN